MRTLTGDPLALILPHPQDRRDWVLVGTVRAEDTQQTVHHYEHRRTQRALRLDRLGRVYGCDREGVVRLFARGGRLALTIALRIVYDGAEELRPQRVRLPAG